MLNPKSLIGPVGAGGLQIGAHTELTAYLSLACHDRSAAELYFRVPCLPSNLQASPDGGMKGRTC